MIDTCCKVHCNYKAVSRLAAAQPLPCCLVDAETENFSLSCSSFDFFKLSATRGLLACGISWVFIDPALDYYCVKAVPSLEANRWRWIDDFGGTTVTDEYARLFFIPTCGIMHIWRLMVTQAACFLTSTLENYFNLLELCIGDLLFI